MVMIQSSRFDFFTALPSGGVLLGLFLAIFLPAIAAADPQAAHTIDASETRGSTGPSGAAHPAS
jgi:hypothetical protein